MKKTLLPLLLLFAAIGYISAQDFERHDAIINGVNDGHAAFYGLANEHTECLSENERQAIKSQIAENVHLLESNGMIHTSRSANPLFNWPLQTAPGYNDYGYYAFVQYLNHNTSNPLTPLDYNCGNKSYYNATSGLYHKGTDIALYPFKWLMLDSSYVQVVAAAAGTIINKSDGNFDHNCTFNTGTWNAVYIQHSDGSVAWYGHLKKGSLTTKNIGDAVQAGEYLGTVGSSGNSKGPHLHFEVYDASGNLIDPFAGTCNSLNTTSWWANQKVYLESGVNRVATNSSVPVFTSCPGEEITNESDNFNQGDTVYFLSYYRGFDSLDLSQIKIYKPDNTLWQQAQFVSPYSILTEAYLYYWLQLPQNAVAGVWRYEVHYKGQVYTHNFTVHGTTGISESSSLSNRFTVYPNPTRDVINLERGNENIPATITITNAIGQAVLQRQIGETETHVQLNLSNLASGVYLVSFNSKNGVETKRLVKQ